MKLACTLAATALLVLSARVAAQPVTHPDPGGTLSVEVHGELPSEDVRTAIAGELAVDVGDGTAFAPSLGRIEVVVDQGIARVAYHPAAGTVIERTFSLPDDRVEALQMIAFVVTNLVRDQARDVLDDLPPIVIPPPVAPPPPRRPPPATRTLPFTIGLVPPLALDRVAGEHVCIGVGIHALAGATDCARVASISGLVDLQGSASEGVQIGGVAALVKGGMRGVQLGGVVALAKGRVRGVQIGGVAAGAGDVEGVQLGGVAAGARNIDGVQIGGVAAGARDVGGVQIGGVASYARRVDGVQLAGVANIGGDVGGTQIGLVNVARRMHGVQVGLVNVANDGDDGIPIGLINVTRNGRVAAEGWVESSRLTGAAIRHGSRHVHNVWGVAWSPDRDHVLVGGGLGAHVAMSGPSIDLDAMHWFANVWAGETSQLEQLRASLTLPVGNLEFFGGAAANVYISDEMDDSATFHPVLARRTTTSGGRAVVAWPSAFVGLRLRAR